MGHLPQKLSSKILNRLDKKNRITCFNYVDPEILEIFRKNLSLDDFQKIVKYDCSPKDTSHAIINRDLYVKIFYNEEIKILEKDFNTLEIKINSQTGKLKFLVECTYVPKGAEYMLVERNFLNKRILTSFKEI